jgi:hypothetical protein
MSRNAQKSAPQRRMNNSSHTPPPDQDSTDVLPKVGIAPEQLTQDYARPQGASQTLEDTGHPAGTSPSPAQDYLSKVGGAHPATDKRLPITRLTWSPTLIAACLGVLVVVNLILLAALRPDLFSTPPSSATEQQATDTSAPADIPAPETPYDINGTPPADPTNTSGYLPDNLPSRRVMVITPQDREALLKQLRSPDPANQPRQLEENRLDTYVRPTPQQPSADTPAAGSPVPETDSPSTP